MDNILGRLTTEYANKQRHNTLDQNSIRIALIHHLAILHRCRKPNLRLTTINQVLVVLVCLGKGLQPVAVFNQQTVSVHPIVETAELLDYFILYEINFHNCSAICLSSSSAISFTGASIT